MRKIFTFLFAALMSVSMFAETVTWDAAIVGALNLAANGEFAKDNVTLKTGDAGSIFAGDWIGADAYDFKFLAPENKVFTKIEITCSNADISAESWVKSENTVTWTGNAATVNFGKAINGVGAIVFTIGDPAPEVDREVTKVGFHFPTANQPGDANIEMGGTFAEGKMAMDKIIATGWFLSNDFVNANEDETFKFYDKTNPKLALCKFIPSNGGGEGKWVQAIFKFGNYWKDDTYKGTPCKSIELDISDDAQYGWKENAPEPVSFTLQLAINDSAMGTVAVTNLLGSGILDLGNGKYTVPEDVEVAIKAEALKGYKFAGWKEGDTAVNTKDNPWKTYISKDVTITATFEAEDQAIDNTAVETKAIKRIVNGQLLIEKNGKFYNAQGAEVK